MAFSALQLDDVVVSSVWVAADHAALCVFLEAPSVPWVSFHAACAQELAHARKKTGFVGLLSDHLAQHVRDKAQHGATGKQGPDREGYIPKNNKR